jgi:hypothetical protein
VLVQVYVDDVIVGSTNEALCKEFEVVKNVYRVMIGSSMYLRESRSDIMLSICLCA